MIAQIIQNQFPWLVPKGFRNEGATALALQLDATISENYYLNSTPTRSEVEDGAIISDHVTLNPEKLAIEGIVSDTPVSILRTLSGATILSKPSQDAFNFLQGLWRSRAPFDFVGGFQVYSKMVLTNFNPVRTPKTGSVLHFTAVMEKIKIVSSEIVVEQKIKDSSKKRGGPKSSKGTQKPFPPTMAQQNGLNDFMVSSPQGVEPTAQAFSPMAGG